MNNFEKIKQMTVKEMGDFLASTTNCGSCRAYDVDKCLNNCTEALEQWLLQEIEK